MRCLLGNKCLADAMNAPQRKPVPTNLKSRSVRPPVLLCLFLETKMLEPITRKFTDWRQRRIAIRHLHALDDRLLADLGTKREDIACFVACVEG
jgi:uncharacterized protein YjiS (DUF1127 family)